MTSIDSMPPPMPPQHVPAQHPAPTGPLAAHRAAIESCIAQWEIDQLLDADGIAGLRGLLASTRVPPDARFDASQIDPSGQWGDNWLQLTAAIDGDVIYLGPDAQEQVLLPCALDAMTLAPDVVVLKVERPEDDGVFDVTRLDATVWWRGAAWTLQLTDHGDGKCLVQLSGLPD
ncbi:hypothetical protein IFT63_15335 [Stenotrophomonas sp. CFBP 13724]|jgi:hypothetical protein|uniref:hypothetical protein n=1 Tax=Stenotrophomonas sp. CFBP 13724 TaxID=2775298 RepID=UPI000AC3908E|nr:hypothetical protein [Stenotrophomonas sp. CFBP 13724]MBD8644956.1 hypothetical protein [Stenotrophomonas sp. CFBP 13724]